MTLETLMAHPVIHRLGWALAHFLWQGAMIALTAAVVLRALKNSSATARYLAACAALGVMAAAPVATFLVLGEGGAQAGINGLALMRQPTSSEATVLPAQPAAGEEPAAAAHKMGDRRGAAAAQSFSARTGGGAGRASAVMTNGVQRLRGAIEPYIPWTTAAWVLGVAVLSLRFLGGWLRVRRIAERGQTIVEGAIKAGFEAAVRRVRVSRPVRLLESALVEAPIVIGWLKPVILFPASALIGLPATQLEAILAHELAHVRRYDYLVNLIQGVIETLLFYHPCVWWISRRIRAEREHCADDAAAEACGDRVLYAQALATLEEVRSALPAVAAGGGALMGRIIRLVNAAPREGAFKGGWLSAAALVAVLALLFAGASTTARAQRDASAKEATESGGGSAAGVLTVGRNKEAAYTSIQAAIDAAPAGAVIRIAPGVYEESLNITKPLTLAGAGWENTTIGPSAVPEAAEALGNLRSQLLSGPEGEREQVIRGFTNTHGRPTVFVSSAWPVSISGLKITALSKDPDAQLMTKSIVEVQNAEAVLSQCAIVGSPMHGIVGLEGSQLEVRNCLVAAVWGTGIEVGAGSAARISDSDVRNCYHRCITIGSDDTIIERCRISGSAWHGIRYDNASPTIEDCFIYDNARFGIYASGETAATVRRNVFYGNEMAGVSCWFTNRDTIEENTFAGNKREALLIVEAARPLVSRNVFFDTPTALSIWPAVSDSPATTDEALRIDNNLFWRNKAIGTRWNPRKDPKQTSVETFGLAELPGNAEEDPLFADAESIDFSLTKGSPARRDGIGAAEPLSPKSPWPLLAEESAIIPDSSTRDFAQWKKPEIVLPSAENAGEGGGKAAAVSQGDAAKRDAGKETAGEAGKTYLFTNPEDCKNWMHITPGAGNEFVDGVARMSAPRGRSFLLNTTPQEADVAVEVKAASESGPAVAWICLRWKDGNNFYEIVLKKTQVEVWRKDKGKYVGILPKHDVALGDAAGTHVLKAHVVGAVPAITVWLDGELVWSGKDETGLGPLDGRYVALETEFSTVAVQSVSILGPDTNVAAATSPAPSGENAASSGVLPSVAFLYHKDREVRGRTIRAFAAKQDPSLIDDLVRAYGIATSSWNDFAGALRDVAGEAAGHPRTAKAWLEAEAAAGRLKIDYLPIDLDALSRYERTQIDPFLERVGPEYFEDAVKTIRTVDTGKMLDALRYMVFNDNVPEVREFLMGDWLGNVLSRELSDEDIFPLPFNLGYLADPGLLRDSIVKQLGACLNSDNRVMVGNALTVIAGPEGRPGIWFNVPEVSERVREIVRGGDAELSRKARRALRIIDPSSAEAR